MLGCVSSSSSSPCDGMDINSYYCDAAADDELVPLKFPLILDLELAAIIVSI
jgi:hypothetical protein